jgi:hypothetical protein
MNPSEIEKIKYLSHKIEQKTATECEKDEYVQILFQNGRISQKHYQEYMNRTSFGEDIFKAAVTVGACFLVTLLIEDLIKKK